MVQRVQRSKVGAAKHGAAKHGAVKQCSEAGQQGAHTQNPLTRAALSSLRAPPAEVPATHPLGAGPGHRGNKCAP